MALFITIISASIFTWALPHVEAIRIGQPWLLYLLPILILPILWDQRHPSDMLSTRDEVAALKLEVGGSARPVAWWVGPMQILFTLIAHLFGASVGREAVGIQLGGWANRLRQSRASNFRACIAAGFAIVLGTPFAAAVFVFESKRWRLNWNDAVGIPLIAWLSYRISTFIGVTHQEHRSFDVVFSEVRSIGFSRFAIFLVLLLTASVIQGALFLHSCDRAKRRKPTTMNRYILPFGFLLVVTAMFAWLGPRAEPSGLPGLGTYALPNLSITDPDTYLVFNHPLLLGILKVFLTAGFVGIGVRGGELTPLLVSGSMTAVGLGALLNLPVAGLVPIGFSVLWGITARRPVTAALIAIEVFGLAPWGVLGLIVAAAVFVGIKLGDAFMKIMRPLGPSWREGLYD